MTPHSLRMIVKRYQRTRGIPTFTETVAVIAGELPASPGAVRHWLAGEREIRPLVAARIRNLQGIDTNRPRSSIG